MFFIANLTIHVPQRQCSWAAYMYVCAYVLNHVEVKDFVPNLLREEKEKGIENEASSVGHGQQELLLRNVPTLVAIASHFTLICLILEILPHGNPDMSLTPFPT